ncbi:hypothetical protein Scep_003023 [Stephania cephalantha]|uniref:AAA+ ATPase domain-containing protein n=1 Tax=Stephania cephalantha TaxID=152367 RepID=A0AAP0LB03_9MAGN
MSDLRDQSSDLHWKKELTALRKAARFLRDPETSSSWRSPLSSRSVATASNLYNVHGTNRHSIGAPHSGRYPELDSCFPVKPANKQKQVFLYNWRQRSNKSSDSGAKLDEEKYLKESSVPGSPGNSSTDAHGEGSKSDSFLEEHVGTFRVREAILETPLQRTVKKLKKNCAVPRQRVVRKSINTNSLNVPAFSLGVPITSVEQSDDTEYCNSEDLRNSAHEFLRKNGVVSRSASPMLPQSANWSHSSILMKSNQREDSSLSCTPASTSSYYRYGNHNPSIVSWDGTTTSFDGDEGENFNLQKSQGCGISCYRSKRVAKDRGCGGCYSPSLSNTLKKGSSILCGSQTLYRRQRASRSNKKLLSSSAQGLPLLTNRCDAGQDSSLDSVQSDDELSTNFGELDLEALSRLDGQRWSFGCRSQEGLEIVPITGVNQRTPDHVGSLSQKYRPRFFEEIIGQSIVVQSLFNAVSKGRIAPVYLFQGPRGTGKTTTARILAAALNCMAIEETKPCGSCRDCVDFVYGRSMDLREVEATSKKGMERVRYLLKGLSVAPPANFSRYKVFIIDECHLLPSKTWSVFLKFLEEPPANLVFIFITTDLDNLPRVLLSRCQKYIFNKIKETDIVTRLKKLCANENLDVESHALDLIALNADGSLRDAETMLDQLSLLGKKITASLVNELVGVVSDEELLDLLELAMSSDTAETVKRARELMDSGVDPMALMSQLAGLIMDIIAGTYQLADTKGSSSFFGGRSLTEAELQRLKQALKLLLEAEKQLRTSSERSTWFTAALLQLGSVHSSDPTNTSSSRKQNSKSSVDNPSGSSLDYTLKKQPHSQYMLRDSITSLSSMATAVGHSGSSGTPCEENRIGSKVIRCLRPDKLDHIWERCIDRCHSKTLKQLLHVHGKLLSISEIDGVLIALIAFENDEIKSRAERFLSSITNSMETVMRRNVEVRIRLMPEASTVRIKPVESPEYSFLKNMEITQVNDKEAKGDNNNNFKSGAVDPQLQLLQSAAESFNCSEAKLPRGTTDQADSTVLQNGRHQITVESPIITEEKVHGSYNKTERKQEIPLKRIQNIIDEQRLETAWLQAAEKGTPESLNKLKAERSQILPQDDIPCPDQVVSMPPESSSQKWDDELNREIKALKISSSKVNQKDPSGQGLDRYQMSPSLLHSRGYPTNVSKENLGYESATSGGGCNGCLCWSSKQPNRRKVKQGVPIRSPRRSSLPLIGHHGKATKIEEKPKR